MGELIKQGFQFFEVMYCGKVIVSNQKAPPTFIDDAVERFKNHEQERQRKTAETEGRKERDRERHSSGTSVQSLPGNLEQTVSITENELQGRDVKLMEESSTDSICGISALSGISEENFDKKSQSSSQSSSSTEMLDKSDPKVVSRSNDSLHGSGDRLSDGLGKGSSSRGDGDDLKRLPALGGAVKRKNRTMLLQIGFSDISLISPDKKSVIMERKFKDISFCSQVTILLLIFRYFFCHVAVKL